jgi:hypothetical protein
MNDFQRSLGSTVGEGRLLEMQNLRLLSLLSLVYNRSFGEGGRRAEMVALDCQTVRL